MKSYDERELLNFINSLVDKVVEDETSNLNEPYLNVILNNQVVFNTYTDLIQLPSKLFNFYFQKILMSKMSIKTVFNQTYTV